MKLIFGDGGAASFNRWLNTHPSSCNDNDNPDHDSTRIAANPQRAAAASMASVERVGSPWLVPGVGISI